MRTRRPGSYRQQSVGRGYHTGPPGFHSMSPAPQSQVLSSDRLGSSAAPSIFGPAQLRPSNSRQQRGQLICFNCQGLGHHFRYCPSPRQPGSTLPPVANYATSPHQHAHDFWALDSGANHHLTNDLANLALHSEYQGTEQVQLSDGPSDAQAVVQRPE
ncbi:Retrovirus-related Pol polyprotein from transposon RE2 [Linum perenne]